MSKFGKIKFLLIFLVVIYCTPNQEVVSETSQPEPTATVENKLVVTSYEELPNALVRIQVKSTQAELNEDLEIEIFEYEGSGSGFFISNDGYIVTNNHVVSGAVSIEVFTQYRSQSYKAQLIGSSECDDLAILKIDINDAQYLTFSSDEPKLGVEIIAAGFPRGDEEVTFLNGIVSKKQTDGSTSWASIDYAFEHTAEILPGSSGGPIVNNNVEAIGIAFAGNEDRQEFGIPIILVKDKIQQMINNNFEYTFKANIEQFVGVGIYIYSVDSSSPLRKAGLRGGEVITTINGLSVVNESTLKIYCNAINLKSSSNAINFKGIDINTLDDFSIEVSLNGEITDSDIETDLQLQNFSSDNITYQKTYETFINIEKIYLSFLETRNEWLNQNITYQEIKKNYRDYIEQLGEVKSTLQINPPSRNSNRSESDFSNLKQLYNTLNSELEFFHIVSNEMLSGLEEPDTGEAHTVATDKLQSSYFLIEEYFTSYLNALGKYYSQDSEATTTTTTIPKKQFINLPVPELVEVNTYYGENVPKDIMELGYIDSNSYSIHLKFKVNNASDYKELYPSISRLRFRGYYDRTSSCKRFTFKVKDNNFNNEIWSYEEQFIEYYAILNKPDPYSFNLYTYRCVKYSKDLILDNIRINFDTSKNYRYSLDSAIVSYTFSKYQEACGSSYNYLCSEEDKFFEDSRIQNNVLVGYCGWSKDNIACFTDVSLWKTYIFQSIPIANNSTDLELALSNGDPNKEGNGWEFIPKNTPIFYRGK